jgi:ribosomal protein S18 acetylase RimI-like enzyme
MVMASLAGPSISGIASRIRDVSVNTSSCQGTTLRTSRICATFRPPSGPEGKSLFQRHGPQIVSTMHIVEIASLSDPLFPAWLDLFELSFPTAERVLVSTFVRALAAPNGSVSHTLLASVGPEGDLVGMADYQSFPAQRVAYLWYLAVRPDRRGAGLGSEIYRAVFARLPSEVCALLLEVEKPLLAPGAIERRLASRRIAFYRRLGAQILEGIRYMQSVGTHQPPLPMHLMVHLRAPFGPEQAFAAAREICGDLIQRTGTLRYAGGTAGDPPG